MTNLKLKLRGSMLPAVVIEQMRAVAAVQKQTDLSADGARRVMARRVAAGGCAECSEHGNHAPGCGSVPHGTLALPPSNR